MNREFAVDFFCRLMRNHQLNVYRFTLPDVPQVDMGFFKQISMTYDTRIQEEEILPATIYMVEDPFSWRYILLRLPQDGSLLLVGPYLNEGASDQMIMAVMEDTGIAPALFPAVRRYYQSLRILSSESQIVPIVMTLGDALFGAERFAVEIMTLRNDARYRPSEIDPAGEINQAENLALIEKRYEIETKLMYAIAHGQSHQASAILSMFNPNQIDRRNANPLRNMKNYAIISNTLMRKAAQQGGVHPFHIDQLSSAIGRRIEEAMTLDEIHHVMGSMAHKYCLLVKNHSMQRYSPTVQSVMLHVDTMLTGDLSLNAHAQRIGVNASYLSALFKKETGVTLTEYVNKQRVGYAIFLLNSTTMQIQTIAQHCGMPDVNYFTRTFKKITGKTPSQYRRIILTHP